MSQSISDVRITVLKKLRTGEVLDEYGQNEPEVCDWPTFEIGRKFMVKNLTMPEGFCSWAWADIQRDVAHLALGGDFPWISKRGTSISCCSDGLKPVVFKLERLTK